MGGEGLPRASGVRRLHAEPAWVWIIGILVRDPLRRLIGNLCQSHDGFGTGVFVLLVAPYRLQHIAQGARDRFGNLCPLPCFCNQRAGRFVKREQEQVIRNSG